MRITNSVAVASVITTSILYAGAAPLDAAFSGAGRARQRASQDRSGPEQTERFSKKVKIGRDGHFTISNVAGDITITGGSGDELTIDAVKRTSGSQRELADVTIDVNAGVSRVDVKTIHTGNRDHVRVDYTITVPSATEVEAKSVSGHLKLSGVQGAVRAHAVSGNITTSDTPKIELIKSVSGNVEIDDVKSDRDVRVESVSGIIRGRKVRLHGLDLRTVSGDVILTDTETGRIAARSVSGSVDYSGSLTKGGAYDISTHSGNVRLSIPESPGFRLTANTFSGAIQSELPLTIDGATVKGNVDVRRTRNGRERGAQAVDANAGDGSAFVTLRTFSGSIVIAKR